MYSRCQKCGKKLTDPESMERGYGPECWSGIAGKYIFHSGEEINIPGQMDFKDFPEMLPEGGEKDERC